MISVAKIRITTFFLLGRFYSLSRTKSHLARVFLFGRRPTISAACEQLSRLQMRANESLLLIIIWADVPIHLSLLCSSRLQLNLKGKPCLVIHRKITYGYRMFLKLRLVSHSSCFKERYQCNNWTRTCHFCEISQFWCAPTPPLTQQLITS